MTIATVALIAWIPVLLLLFLVLPPRRAVVVGYLFAWLFLPAFGYPLPGLPDVTKISSTSIGIMLGVVLLDPRRFASIRLHWVDLPMIVWCLCPFASSFANGLGAYDGVSAVFQQAVLWGLPYLMGRLYLRDTAGLRELAVGIFVGGLIYIPLCLFENRMSPQLHNVVYGFNQVSRFREYSQFGFLGWQPRVFMENGLSLTMYMASASVVGVWLWMSGAMRRMGRIPIAWPVLALITTTILCKGLGGNFLMFLGIATLFFGRLLRTRLPLLCVIAVVPLYLTVRMTGSWSGAPLVTLVRTVSDARAHSLQTRLDNEEILVDKALRRPVFGWGRWGRARVFDAAGRDTSLTDGLWVIALGNAGLVGLFAVTAVLLSPAILFLRSWRAEEWELWRIAPAVALCVILVLYAIDKLFNAMPNPVFMLAAGGLLGFTLTRKPGATLNHFGFESETQRGARLL